MILRPVSYFSHTWLSSAIQMNLLSFTKKIAKAHTQRKKRPVFLSFCPKWGYQHWRERLYCLAIWSRLLQSCTTYYRFKCTTHPDLPPFSMGVRPPLPASPYYLAQHTNSASPQGFPILLQLLQLENLPRSWTWKKPPLLPSPWRLPAPITNRLQLECRCHL